MFIQKHIKSIIIAIIIAISLYIISAIALGWNESLALIKKISAAGWLSLLACSFSSYLIRYARWYYFIKTLGHVISHKLHFLYYLSGFALTITPAKIGETIRSMYLYQHGISYTKSLSAFFIERLLDLTIVTSLSSLLLYQHQQYKFFIAILLTLIVTLIILLQTHYIHLLLKYLTKLIKFRKLNKFIFNIKELLEHSRLLLNYRSLFFGTFLGFMAWSIQGTAFYILLTQLGFTIPVYIAISIYSIALISGALSFIPGGIGSTEIVMGVFLYNYGAPKEIVIMAPIIIRMTSLWFAVIIGLISTVVITKNLKKS